MISGEIKGWRMGEMCVHVNRFLRHGFHRCTLFCHVIAYRRDLTARVGLACQRSHIRLLPSSYRSEDCDVLRERVNSRNDLNRTNIGI